MPAQWARVWTSHAPKISLTNTATLRNVNLKIVKSTLFERVLSDVSAMLNETAVKILLNSVDFTIFKLTVLSH